MSFMAHYKTGQGRQARSLASILMVLILAWGCYAFFEYGNSKLDRLLDSLFGMENPIFGMPLIQGGSTITSWITPSLLLAILVFMASMWWARGFLNKPKMADHLIGTELEMRRVKWPTRPEVARAGTMVVYYTFWLSLIIFVIDLMMTSVVYTLLGQKFSEVGLGKILSGIYSAFGG